MFESFRRRFGKNAAEILGAPVAGEAVTSAEIRDAAYRGEMLGKGMAIKPVSGKVFAPVDGVISLIFGTKHAFTIVSDGGAEVLVHIGIDTVSLAGAPFTVYVDQDARVKKGDLIAEFDMNIIEEAKLDTITSIVILNTEHYKKIECFTKKLVKPGEDIMYLKRGQHRKATGISK